MTSICGEIRKERLKFYYLVLPLLKEFLRFSEEMFHINCSFFFTDLL